MTLMAAAKIELIETALAGGKYRTLQKQLRELRDAQQIIIQGYLSDSHESLKEEAQRLILELKPIAEVETQGEITTATVKQKIKKVLASLPAGTIANNSDFSDRINTGTADEKIWLVNKDKNGAGVTFVKTECGRYYESYAGDAIRSIALLGMPTFVEGEVLRTLVAIPDAVRLQENAQKLGLILHLYDRANNTETLQDATATTESERQLDWEKELPDTFPEYPKDKGLREKFRRMFNQLNKQGILVEYARPFFGKNFEQWLLTGGNKTEGEIFGRLSWYRELNKWTIDGFYFQDEEGNPIDEFNDVESV